MTSSLSTKATLKKKKKKNVIVHRKLVFRFVHCAARGQCNFVHRTWRSSPVALCLSKSHCGIVSLVDLWPLVIVKTLQQRPSSFLSVRVRTCACDVVL